MGHIIGKAYEITKENINRLASELDETKEKNETLRAALAEAREAFINQCTQSVGDKDYCCCQACTAVTYIDGTLRG